MSSRPPHHSPSSSPNPTSSGAHLHGLGASAGIALGHAVVWRSSTGAVPHRRIDPSATAAEVQRWHTARDAVATQMRQLLNSVRPTTSANTDTPTAELLAVLEVHLMLLQDPSLDAGVRHGIEQLQRNAQWALDAHVQQLCEQFDAMDDAYLRERRADVEQLARHLQAQLVGGHGITSDVGTQQPQTPDRSLGRFQAGSASHDRAPILVAHDITPMEMLQLRGAGFAAFVTAVGTRNSHMAIVARSMGLPAVVGVKGLMHAVLAGDALIVNGETGQLFINPAPEAWQHWQQRREQQLRRQQLRQRLLHTPSLTRDGQRVQLLANIEQPADTAAAVAAGAVGVGLFRSEFLFMQPNAHALPDEQQQYEAYRAAVQGMHGMPVTVRTIDIGADKPLLAAHDDTAAHATPNPALGLRAVRWSLAQPEVFRTQIRAILRAAAHGQVLLLIPMLSHARQVAQVLAHIERAEHELQASAHAWARVQIGAMVEVPAAALMATYLARHFDFLSIGTNDLIQYTLAIDRSDESVAALYDPLHPAVLQLIAHTIASAQAQGKSVSVCGDMAADPTLTDLLLGLGLRSFSVPAAQLLSVKERIVRADTRRLEPWARQMLHSDNPTLHPSGRHA